MPGHDPELPGPGSGAAAAPAEYAGAPGAPEDAPLEWKGLRLLPFQREAVRELRAGKSLLVSAPTGAGKTLVAEVAIEDAVRRGRRCIYTAPIKALSNQKYRDFRDDPEVDVGLMTGDVTIHPGAQVLIMTTEILRNTIFEDPDRLHDVEYVVFDEIHFMDDPERGSVWEECLIFAPRSIRFVGLSATIANLDELGAWIREIREQDLAVVSSRKRPVPLSHHLFHPSLGTFELRDLPEARRRMARARRRARTGRGGKGPAGNRRRGGRPRSFEPPQPGLLLDELQERGLLPVLVFAFSRRDCERLARRNVGRELLDRDAARRMDELQAELVRLFQLDPAALDGEVFAMARHGVGYHHAGMLPVHKELVERMFTSGLLRMLFTTETFALGINMPARSVLFHSLRKFDGVSVDWLTTRDYLQMAGRAGRQGLDERGLVFSMLDERDVLEGPLERLLEGRPEPVESRFRLSYSTLLHLLERMDRERLLEAWDKSFQHYQLRDVGEKARRRHRRRQHRLVEAHLAVLTELGYVDAEDRLTPRGATARTLNGYELQITELLFRGLLEDLPARGLAMVFVAQIFQDRRRGEPRYVPRQMFLEERRRISRSVAELVAREASLGIPAPMKMPDWGLTPEVLAWYDGATMDELVELGDASGGDVCRTFRMAVQLMRQVRKVLGPRWDLSDRLSEAISALNRDEIDARRQLELG